MPRFSPGVALLSCAAILVAACDAPHAGDLLSPDVPLHEIVDGRGTPSNVYLLPPIGESYTALNFDEYTLTRVEVCTLPEISEDGVTLDLVQYAAAHWDMLEDSACVATVASYGEEIALTRDDFGNPQHYQLNLKTNAEDYNQAFRVTVSTLSGFSPVMVGEEVVKYESYWQPKAYFGLALFENSSAINVPDDWVGETAGQNFPVKYLVEYQESDSFAVRVDCDGGTFVGPTAGIIVGDSAFGGCPGEVLLVLVQEPVQTDACLPVGWEQDGPCYRWQLYQSDDGGITYEVYDGGINEAKLTVAYCLVDVYADPHLWSGFKTPAPYDSVVTPTASTDLDPYGDFDFDCSLVQPQESGLLGVLQRVHQFLGLGPELLYAAHGGFGELVFGGKTLSHFGRALAQTLPEEYVTGGGQSGLINTTLPEPLVVRAMTIPHPEAVLQGDGTYVYPTEPPVGVPNQEVIFEVIAGGGSLSEFDPVTETCVGTPQSVDTVKTSAELGDVGYARACWTLGPDESQDQEVIAYGPDSGRYGSIFGHVEDPDEDSIYEFVDDEILFSATAYNVVTDFLQPLDEKDGYSGDPITGIVPAVVIDCVYSELDPTACTAFSQQFDETEIKLTEDGGRWFFQVNWKPRDFGITEGTYVVQVALDGSIVVGESVEIVVEKGGKVELENGQLNINPTTDLPIKFTLSRPKL